MKKRAETYSRLKAKYTQEDLADAVMLPEIGSIEEEAEARAEFVKLRMARKETLSENEQLLSKLLAIKYQIKAYLNQNEFKPKGNFGVFLKTYLKATGRSQKRFAEEIGLHPSRLNRIIKGKERIGKAIAYRLENHSGEIIPAIFWWKLMQKEIEQEILTEKKEREIEKQYVKKVAYRA